MSSDRHDFTRAGDIPDFVFFLRKFISELIKLQTIDLIKSIKNKKNSAFQLCH